MHFEEQSVLGTIDEASGDVEIAFPLPPEPFLEAPETAHQLAIVTERPLIDPKPSVGTFHYPNIQQMNRFYGRRVSLGYSPARIEPDGLELVIGLSDTDLRLRGISPLNLATEMFSLAGISATQSSAGKVAMRVIQQMGGLDNCRVFKIKGVRDLLHEFSLPKAFSHSQALARIGPGFQVYKRLFIEPRESTELDPQDVFLYLLKKKVIRTGVELECSNCRSPEWRSLDDLAETVTCPYCGSPFDCGPQLQDRCWFYRVSGVFARTRDNEGAIPVTLALQQVMRCLDFRGVAWTTGMNLSWSESGKAIDGETDLVVTSQDHEQVPELLIGECETGMELNAEQIERLVNAAARFADTGIKVYIMFAKAATTFTDRELELIDARQTIDFNFILLTARELEPNVPYVEATPDSSRGMAPATLGQWAHYSQELYLKSKPADVLQRQVRPTSPTKS